MALTPLSKLEGTGVTLSLSTSSCIAEEFPIENVVETGPFLAEREKQLLFLDVDMKQKKTFSQQFLSSCHAQAQTQGQNQH